MPESISAALNQVLNTGRKDYVWDGTNWRGMLADTAGAARVGIVETIQTELFAAASVAASSQAASTILSMAGIKKALIFIDHGRAATAAFGTQGTEYRVEASQRATGDGTWRAMTTVVAGSTAALAVSASADVAAGSTTITVDSGTSIPARGDIVFWANTVSAASSEWMRVTSVSGTASFVIQDGLDYGQDSDTSIYTQAEQWALVVDVEAITRLRVVVNNNASGTTQAIYSRIACITES